MAALFQQAWRGSFERAATGRAVGAQPRSVTAKICFCRREQRLAHRFRRRLQGHILRWSIRRQINELSALGRPAAALTKSCIASD